MTEKERIASPEWLVSMRSDTRVDDSLREGWGIRPAPLARGASYTDFGSHIMAVPSGDGDAERATVLHELLHARLSPTSIVSELMEQMGVTTEAVRLAEEVRINWVGRKAGHYSSGIGDTKHLSDGSESNRAKSAVERGSWHDAVCLMMDTINTDSYSKVKRALRKNVEWRDSIAFIEKEIRSAGLLFGKNENYNTQLNISGTYPILYKWGDRKGKERTNLIPSGFHDVTLPLAMSIDEWLQHPPREAKGNTIPGKPMRVSRPSSWEQLRFSSLSLTEPTAKFIGRRKRPSMTGKYPRRPDRLLTDPERRIFREEVKTNGGIVVFDCSGSMSISHGIVEDMVKQFSGATVVLYSHVGSNRPNAHIVARNGRMIAPADYDKIDLHSGNGVDLPILKWAVRQRKTRKDFILWVSDGHVTGKRDSHSDDLLDEVARFVRRHNIVGVDNYREAIALLADMKRGRPIPRDRHCHLITQRLRELGSRVVVSGGVR